jgi:hypothetical protein
MENRINYAQAEQLRGLLERVKKLDEQQGNQTIVIALAFLLGLVISYLVTRL